MPKSGVVDRRHMVCKFVSHEEQELETIRYWNARSIGDKMRETAELTEYFYGKKGLMRMLRDQLDLLSVFNDHKVEYLVVGGHAVNAYTQGRATKDLDVLIRSNEANSVLVFKALVQFGAPSAGISPVDFQDKPGQCFQLGVEPNRIDILQSIAGVMFDDAWQKATTGEVEGIPVRFISREDLIVNKLAVGRPRDLGDVDELRKFAREL